MKTGLLAAKGDLVAFVDADLRGLRPEHIYALCVPVAQGLADMTLGRRQYEVWSGRLMATPYTGERCFRRSRLLESLHCFDVQRYGIEASLNKDFFRRGNVVVVPLRGVAQTCKRAKVGVLKGTWGSCKMLFQMGRTTGCLELVYQMVKATRFSVERNP